MATLSEQMAGAGIKPPASPMGAPTGNSLSDKMAQAGIKPISQGPTAPSTPSNPFTPTGYVPGSESALIPATPLATSGSGFMNAQKITPNALGDIGNLTKEGVYGTPKKILSDIPSAMGGLAGEMKGLDFGTNIKNILLGTLQGTKEVGQGMIPQSAKELLNTQGMAKAPAEFAQLAKDKGGYWNAFKEVAKNVPESVVPGIQNFISQIDRAGQAFINHPVYEALGYLGLKQIIGAPKEFVSETNKGIKTTTDMGKTTIEAVKHPVETATNIANTVKNMGNNAAEILNNTKTALARSNKPQNLETSIDRLNTAKPETNPIGGLENITGKKVLGQKTPLDTYNEFIDQEAKFKNDIKADTAVGKVGERIGNAYDQVVAARRTAGKQMETEMKTIGNLPTDIKVPQNSFTKTLFDQGLTFGEKGKLIPTKLSKFTTEDVGQLQEYLSNLNKLGTTPTAAELDAFLSRTPKELEVYNAKNNVTKVTNAERMIKANLSALRDSISPEANPAFSGYSKAKDNYSALTKFLDEGNGLLGKKTQSGDYAKDASIAKSSVQSILNSGKKDWLMKLEDLTGYKALDEATLAIQAMKDSGNFRGQSLLDLLQPKEGGNIPTSSKGLIEKGFSKGLEFGKEKFIGSPIEQTRNIIRERMKTNSPIPGEFQRGGWMNTSSTNPMNPAMPKNIITPMKNDINSTIPESPGKSNLGTLFPKGEGATPKTTESPNLTGLSRQLIDLTNKTGGATLSLNGEVPTGRYIYSPDKTTEFAIPKEQVTEESVARYIEKNLEQLKSGKFIGLWEDGGQIYHDITKASNDLEGSLSEAGKANQIAIYDQQTGQSINVGEATKKAPPIQDETRGNSAGNGQTNNPRANQSGVNEGATGKGLGELTPKKSDNGLGRLIKSSSEFKKHNFSSLDEMMSHAPKTKEHIDNVAGKIAKATGNTFAETPNKKIERIREKLKEPDIAGDHNNINDVARNSIVLDNPKTYDEIISQFKKQGIGVKIKVQKPENYMGYEGTIINHAGPTGLNGETQIVTPTMIFGKFPEADAAKILGQGAVDKIRTQTGLEPGLGHAIYEKFRVLSPKEQAGEAGKNLIKQSIAYYSKL